MPKIGKTPRQPKEVSGEGYCRMCQKVLPSSKFYEATNPMIDISGLMSVCRDHCNEIYTEYFKIYNNMETALQNTCRDLDVCFNQEAFRQTQSHIEKLLNQGKRAETIFGYYKSKLCSTGKNNAGISSFRFKDSDIYNNDKINTFNYELEKTDFDVTQDLIRFWGTNFNPEEYEYLSEKMDEYLNTFECETPSMEELLKQAAFESLEIRNKRQKREDVSKNLKNLQDLLGSANIKPNQESGANATEQATFSLLLKKWENEEPVPEPDEEWKDVDGIGKYIRVWFLGHLCKMMGIVNEHSKEYEEEMARLRVNLPSSEPLTDEMDEGE